MKDLKTGFWAVFGIILVLTLWVLIFTSPFYWMWNCIISPKFNLPYLTFVETFFIILMMKWLFSTSDIKSIKQKIDNK
jgi:hypothetical protein